MVIVTSRRRVASGRSPSLSIKEFFGLVLAVAMFPVASVTVAQHDHHTTSARVVSVHLATSCKPKVAAMFDRGLALLHSFWFSAAYETFRLVEHSDVDCAMAWWGMALAQWGDPFEQGRRPAGALEVGRWALSSAQKATSATPRERKYLAAVTELYADGEPRERATAYERAMIRLSEEFPDDREAAVFAALATLVLTERRDERANAAAHMERLYRERPDHPGLAQYVIRAYDDASMASQSLDEAKHYAEIAPPAAYALHVPSHIYTRLGMWHEVLEVNLASADAARRDGAAADELHALDFQVYASLQMGQDQQAASVARRLSVLESRVDADSKSTTMASAARLALAAIPARVALELGDWSTAASLVVDQSTVHAADAQTHFARGIGAIRSGQIAAAREALAQLRAVRNKLGPGDAKWGAQVDTRGQILQAWILFAEAKSAAALQLLTRAADEEDKTADSIWLPGQLLPARELLGEMLLEMNRPADALTAFEQTLARSPNRLRALFGAADAARKAGNSRKSAEYDDAITAICRNADDPPRAMIAAARARQQASNPVRKK
jgi:tetratricopeptide (TPR) repeat protein